MDPALHEETDDLLPPAAGEGDEECASDTGGGGPEPLGVADGDELLLSQLDDDGDDFGLDTVAGVDGGLDVASLVDADEAPDGQDHGSGPVGEDSLPVIDTTGEEDGWLAESAGDASLMYADLSDDEPGREGDDGGLEGDDGGLEGTDDALYEPLDEALPALVADEDGDDAAADELEQELIRELRHGA